LRSGINGGEITLTKDSFHTEHGGPIEEKADSLDQVRRVLNCELLGNTYCLELDDGTLLFMDFSCG
jgi:hypothetical protein